MCGMIAALPAAVESLLTDLITFNGEDSRPFGCPCLPVARGKTARITST